jgi:hypothetical protein
MSTFNEVVGRGSFKSPYSIKIPLGPPLAKGEDEMFKCL